MLKISHIFIKFEDMQNEEQMVLTTKSSHGVFTGLTMTLKCLTLRVKDAGGYIQIWKPQLPSDPGQFI